MELFPRRSYCFSASLNYVVDSLPRSYSLLASLNYLMNVFPRRSYFLLASLDYLMSMVFDEKSKNPEIHFFLLFVLFAFLDFSPKTHSSSNLAKLIGNGSSQETNSLSNLAKLIGNNSSQETHSLSNLAKLIGNSSSQETNSLSNLAKLRVYHLEQCFLGEDISYQLRKFT